MMVDDLDALLSGIGIDDTPQKQSKVQIPSWYFDKKMKTELQRCVDVSIELFEEKLAVINSCPDINKYIADEGIKSIQIRHQEVATRAGLKEKYLHNHKRVEYQGKVVQFIEELTERLATAAEAQKLNYSGRSTKEKLSDYENLKDRYDELLNQNYQEYALTVFEKKMMSALKSQDTSSVILYEDKVRLEGEVERLQQELDELRAKYKLEVQKNQRFSVIDGGKDDG